MHKRLKEFLVVLLEVAALFVFAGYSAAEYPYYTTKSGDCGQNYGAPKGRVGKHRVADPQGGWQTKGLILDTFGPMPQTAYDPNFGCYPGNARTIQRYPAFHGYYYDRPTNYRHYTEYPWNADIAEPRPMPDYRAQSVGSQVNTDSVIVNDGVIMEPVTEGIDNTTSEESEQDGEATVNFPDSDSSILVPEDKKMEKDTSMIEPGLLE